MIVKQSDKGNKHPPARWAMSAYADATIELETVQLIPGWFFCEFLWNMLKSKEWWAREIEGAGKYAVADMEKWHWGLTLPLSDTRVQALLLPAEPPHRLTSILMFNIRTLKDYSFTLAKLHQVSDPLSTPRNTNWQGVKSSFITSKGKSLRLSSEA